ncbi:MAG: small subunit ribosomal protein S3 [Microgenomates group bacterium LiPW_31]|nr:MAG: small subunit ribosomal protein S3 [Microgenomates group bacterium LiPW_31]
MGQKVNPIGFRLPQNLDWQSRWFSDNKRRYQQNLLEDVKIRKFLMEKLKLAGIIKVQIDRLINKMKITLFVSRPGVVIGRGGTGLELLKKELLKLITIPEPEKNLDLDVVEIKNPELSAHLVALRIVEQLGKRLPYRRVISKAIERVMAAGAQGIRVVVSGRIGGADISRREKFQQGKVPLGTLRADIDYAQIPAFTKWGYVGVKVWIYKGEKE